jgi:endonuclease-3 related protein
MRNLNKIYQILLKEYNHQKWWPTTLEKDIHPTYHGQKLNDKMRFEIVVGAILTQNTSWKNVEKAIIELNKRKLLTIKGILQTKKIKLEKIIRSAGYYRQKAERLKIIAKFFKENSFNKLKKERTEKLREILLSLKGIGPETADSIMLYAFEKPIFVIDAYTKRICFNLGVCKENVSYDELQNAFMKKLKPNAKMFNEYHALIVCHAKNCYSKKPYKDELLK